MGSLTQIMHMSPNVNRLISLPPLDLTSIFQLSHGHIEDAELSNGVPVGERQSEEDLFERYMNFETYRDKGKGKVYARVLGTNSLGLSKTGGSTLLPARWSIDSEESRESTTGNFQKPSLNFSGLITAYIQASPTHVPSERI